MLSAWLLLYMQKGAVVVSVSRTLQSHCSYAIHLKDLNVFVEEADYFVSYSH